LKFPEFGQQLELNKGIILGISYVFGYLKLFKPVYVLLS
jgi:hypothetical protein